MGDPYLKLAVSKNRRFWSKMVQNRLFWAYFASLSAALTLTFDLLPLTLTFCLIYIISLFVCLGLSTRAAKGVLQVKVAATRYLPGASQASSKTGKVGSFHRYRLLLFRCINLFFFLASSSSILLTARSKGVCPALFLVLILALALIRKRATSNLLLSTAR